MPPGYEPLSQRGRPGYPVGGRMLLASSCRDEVVAALSTVMARDTRPVFTVREVYTEMVTSGTQFAESIVFKTMQRMKESRTPDIER